MNFIELKVRKKDLSFYQKRTYNCIKTRTWWCQSFLVGVSKIIVGLRNDNGLVDSIEEVEVNSLIKQGQNYWSGNNCIEFLTFMLKFIKEKTSDLNCPHTVVDFYYNSDNRHISYKKTEGKSPSSFLPDWYITAVKSQHTF
ncbi:decapping nuclease DXO homolog [Teleopsis dalmanni]|nr:decapping nuclease DXO homolog [Teleopsis dalmanni]